MTTKELNQIGKNMAVIAASLNRDFDGIFYQCNRCGIFCLSPKCRSCDSEDVKTHITPIDYELPQSLNPTQELLKIANRKS